MKLQGDLKGNSIDYKNEQCDRASQKKRQGGKVDRPGWEEKTVTLVYVATSQRQGMSRKTPGNIRCTQWERERGTSDRWGQMIECYGKKNSSVKMAV